MATTTIAPNTHQLTEQELQAWRGLLCTHATLVKALDAQLAAEHDLPLSSYEVLMFVSDSENGRMRMHDVADRVLLSRSGLTRLVDRLVRDGLVVRESCPGDARGSFAVITDAGRELMRHARATHLAGIRALFLDKLTPEEQQQLGAIFDRVLTAGDVVDPRGMCPANE
jgi:DNA-binding MarR family transcriptional regulator